MKRKVVALTGKIGSGKSAVAQILRQMGYETVDCDELAKQVAEDTEVLASIEQLLGSRSVDNGKLNRKYVRETVFNDETLLKTYQQIFFERVQTLLTEALARLGGNKTVFVEIPVLDAFVFDFDEVWRVESSEQNCVCRVVARDEVSADNVTATLNRQKTYDCVWVIENNGDLDMLAQSVRTALANRQLI